MKTHGKPFRERLIISDEKVLPELKRLLLIGWVLVATGLVAFGFIALASVIIGVRCITLSRHKLVARMPHGVWLKMASIMLVVISILECVAYEVMLSKQYF